MMIGLKWISISIQILKVSKDYYKYLEMIKLKSLEVEDLVSHKIFNLKDNKHFKISIKII